jgi:NADH-quinone oxidoreductase subunit L
VHLGLAPEEHGHHYGLGVEWGFIAVAILIAAAGLGIARYLYRTRPDLPGAIASRLGAIYRLVLNKYYVDELYRIVFVNNLLRLSRSLSWIDANLVDGAVNGTARGTVLTARASSEVDRLGVDGTVNTAGHLVQGGSLFYRRLQTGFTQNYAIGILLGAFALVSIYLLFG